MKFPSKKKITFAMISILVLLIFSNFIFLNSVKTSDLSHGTELKILTYNLHDNPLTTPLDQIMKMDLDLLVLQEMIPQNENETGEIADKLGMEYFDVDSYNLTLYNQMIFSKWPIIEQSWSELTTVSFVAPRAMLKVVVDTPDGQITCVSTHLNTPNYIFTRLKQTNEILDFIGDKERVILSGDFNTVPSFMDPVYQKLTESFGDLWLNSDNASSKGNT